MYKTENDRSSLTHCCFLGSGASTNFF